MWEFGGRWYARLDSAAFIEVTGVTRTSSGEWQVRTSKGDIVAEHVVCATGNYARQTGRMFGLNVPAIPVEHQYILFEESQKLKDYRTGGGRELAVLRESDQSYYLREERLGWILGPYEKGAPARFAEACKRRISRQRISLTWRWVGAVVSTATGSRV